jgi:hypothetical protein
MPPPATCRYEVAHLLWQHDAAAVELMGGAAHLAAVAEAEAVEAQGAAAGAGAQAQAGLGSASSSSAAAAPPVTGCQHQALLARHQSLLSAAEGATGADAAGAQASSAASASALLARHQPLMCAAGQAEARAVALAEAEAGAEAGAVGAEGAAGAHAAEAQAGLGGAPSAAAASALLARHQSLLSAAEALPERHWSSGMRDPSLQALSPREAFDLVIAGGERGWFGGLSATGLCPFTHTHTHTHTQPTACTLRTRRTAWWRRFSCACGGRV